MRILAFQPVSSQEGIVRTPGYCGCLGRMSRMLLRRRDAVVGLADGRIILA